MVTSYEIGTDIGNTEIINVKNIGVSLGFPLLPSD
jgi:hypothetical protein